jgi:hypothetical protein
VWWSSLASRSLLRSFSSWVQSVLLSLVLCPIFRSCKQSNWSHLQSCLRRWWLSCSVCLQQGSCSRCQAWSWSTLQTSHPDLGKCSWSRWLHFRRSFSRWTLNYELAHARSF